LRVIAQLEPVVAGTAEACSAELRRVNATFDRYLNIGVIDPDGYIRCAAQLTEPPVFAGDRDYYQLAIETGDVVQGSYQIGRITGLPAVNYGLAISTEDGAFRGVVYAALAIEAIVAVAERASADEREVIIISANGETLASSEGLAFAAGEGINEATLTRLRLESPGTATIKIHNQDVIAGFTTLPGPKGPAAYVLVVDEKSRIEASAQSVFRWSTGVLAATVVLSMGAATVVSETLVVAEHRKRSEARAARIRRLQDADADRIRLVNSIGHDLASPLTPIRLQLHMLRARLKDEKDARAVEVINLNFQQIQRLVADLRDIFKLQAGRLNLTPVGFDLYKLASDARDSVAPTAAPRGINVVLNAERDLQLIADKDRVYQTIMNFLTNAIKFSPRDGRVAISVFPEGEGVRLAVKDGGRGLTPEEIDRLFEPFSQVHDRGEVEEEGTGLGLFICRGIVEGHGGRIGVNSAGRGTGSEFWFWLPREARVDEPPMDADDSEEKLEEQA
jgi:signal transduction histidine kinase